MKQNKTLESIKGQMYILSETENIHGAGVSKLIDLAKTFYWAATVGCNPFTAEPLYDKKGNVIGEGCAN